ncbi:MAG: 1-deoxy-D-xylulose-5-phosphate reductoisomerase, partial [Ruminococcaceae bacterium]|nr:1-deoxy-D-xylulose-5-phosphate reductoisomerase [Oscillospiraceae bacterium]
MKKIKVAVLGSTGSVGTQALDAVRNGDFEVVMLSAGNNADLLAKQAAEFGPKLVTTESREAADRLRSMLPTDIKVLSEKAAILDAVRTTEADVIIHAVSGLAGIDYALAAADSGKRIGMANKEAIISLGDIINRHLAASGGTMVPVDSEHSAVFQCLHEEKAPV